MAKSLALLPLFNLILCATTAHAAATSETIAHVEQTYDPAIAVVSRKEKVAAEFSPLLWGCKVQVIHLRAKDPVTLEAGDVQFRLYSPRGTDAAQVRQVVIAPPTGGETVLDRGFADALCQRGFRAAIAERWDHDTETSLDMGMHDRGALRAMAAIRHVIEYLHPKRPAQLGIFGTSLGAIDAAMVVGYEPRISAEALIVGGGGMPKIIAESDESGMTKLRNERFKEFGYANVADYERALAPVVQIDPLDSAATSHLSAVWMMIAKKDHTVVTESQLDLREAYLLNHVPVDDHSFPGNHVETIIYAMPTHWASLVDFFSTHLK